MLLIFKLTFELDGMKLVINVVAKLKIHLK